MKLHCATVDLEDATHELVGILEARFSIQVNPERLEAFQFAVQSFACERFGDIAAMVHDIKSGLSDPALWAQILHVATNHETRFFRHPPSLDMVIQSCRGKSIPKILSVGCSSGEEPYSIATALLRDGHPAFKVVGVDISVRCIETARQGIYRAHPKLDADVAAQIGNGKARIHSWIRDMVDFEVHNILSSTPLPITNPDVIITQNMLIYYRTETRHEILSRLALELPSGGVLIAGPAEDAGWKVSGMSRIPYSNASVFKKD